MARASINLSISLSNEKRTRAGRTGHFSLPAAACAGLICSVLSAATWSNPSLPPSTASLHRSVEQLTQPSPQPINDDARAGTALAAAASDRSVNGLSLHQGDFLWYGDDAWITDIGTLLYSDRDNDGYYTGFGLTIDADTWLSVSEVYVSIDIQRSFAPRERLHTSNVFSLYGRSLSDDYRIDIGLVQNYPAGHYDLTVHLHDAYDGRLLDSVSADDFTNLSGLPLESEEYDSDGHPVEEPLRPGTPVYNDDVRVVEYAGSSSLALLIVLGLIVLQRKPLQRKRKPA